MLRINFAGGEPLLCPWLRDLIRIAKGSGLTTALITNGSHLTEAWLREMQNYLDWIGISIDSLCETTNMVSGRAVRAKKPLSEADYRNLCEMIKKYGYHLKINTVLHRFNFQEDFSTFIEDLQPERWKIFQVLRIESQNDHSIDKFLISNLEFDAFVRRHQHLSCNVPERCEEIKGSYLMIDPAGRFFDNLEGLHHYSDPILEVGVEKALTQIKFSYPTFLERGGLYEWSRKKNPKF